MVGSGLNDIFQLKVQFRIFTTLLSEARTLALFKLRKEKYHLQIN